MTRRANYAVVAVAAVSGRWNARVESAQCDAQATSRVQERPRCANVGQMTMPCKTPHAGGGGVCDDAPRF